MPATHDMWAVLAQLLLYINRPPLSTMVRRFSLGWYRFFCPWLLEVIRTEPLHRGMIQIYKIAEIPKGGG